MALFMAEQGDRTTALIYLVTGVLLFGPMLLFFSKQQEDEAPEQDAQVPRIMTLLLLGILATALMMASGAPTSAAAMLAAASLYALPVPTIRHLSPEEYRLRTVLFCLLLAGAIAVMTWA